ncbi:Type IV fimbrial assembly, ATPase PilB [hydrothermal vent metagenome]|uniref:Type IV fimbrial assembly, ATPase PilB n=1 Tax=hydrothermal vent metagenome TaxID=652676 RepID=A0A3B1B9K5_9ZZZZ
MAEIAEKRTSFKKSIQDNSRGDVLGKMLAKDGQITRSQLKEAEEIQKKTNVRTGKILQKLGYIDEDSIIKFLSRQLSIPIADFVEEKPDPGAIKFVPWELAKEHMVLPVRSDGKTLRLAMLDPTSMKAIELIGSHVKQTIKPLVIAEEALLTAFKTYYKISDEEHEELVKAGELDDKKDEAVEEIDMDKFDDIGGIISDASEEVEIEQEIEDEGQLYNSGDAAIIKLVNGILLKAIQQGASDIHIEPYEKSFQVRYRMDGSLFRAMNLPVTIKAALISRFKIMSNLNIAEKRRPQDGRIKLKLGKGKAVDFRVSVLPTLFGESIVARILDQSNLQIDMKKLGFTSAMLTRFMALIERPQGLILVTGPTGSGKTNTLYSGINILNKPDVKILTAEDPVEFNFAGINQVNVRPEVGLTFASALKAFLRQDPEIILVGEIRDMETAEIALKASMTGHMVFSTLHTNDCASTIGRLLDIGIKGYMVSSALTLVLAQRLLRRICANCKIEDKDITPQVLLDAGVAKEQVPKFTAFKGKGCPTCSGTGYKGRLGVFEMMEATQPIKEAITAQVQESALLKIAIKGGMLTLRMDALGKVREGTTTMEEVLKRTVLVKEALPAYLQNPDELTFEDGDLIIKEGNTDKNFYQLLQGGLLITKSGRIVGEISQPGEYFGEMSALMNQPRTATIKSKGKSIVKVFPGDKLKQTLESYPEIALNIIHSLITRLNDANKMLARVGERAPK